MKYYSTNKQAQEATLQEAVVKGLASDKGLFMPETIEGSNKVQIYDEFESAKGDYGTLVGHEFMDTLFKNK